MVNQAQGRQLQFKRAGFETRENKTKASMVGMSSDVHEVGKLENNF